jgi:flagellar hook protein FlgE
MASTTALYTGLSGMQAHSRRLDVIGNNIANANTTAFKSSRLMFADQFYRTYNPGSAPNAEQGGSNPLQIGLGVTIAGTQRDFNPGSISATGDGRDLAIDGKGFFVVDRSGTQMFTRAGSFRQNAMNDLVTIDGDRVRGFGIDGNFNVIAGPLVDVNIPVGTMKLAEATRSVNFTGNLNADGAVATRGSSVRLGATDSTGLRLIPGATVPPPGGSLIAGNSLLVEVADPSALSTAMFAPGQVIEVRGAEKGHRTLPTERYQVTASSTVADLMAFLSAALGLNAAAGPNPDGEMPGVRLNPATGVLTVVGNTGTVNDLAVESTDIRLLDAGGALVRAPLHATKQVDADGEAVRTTFVVYDSLGTPVTVDLAMVLEGKSNGGTGWRYYLESPDNAGGALAIGTGLIGFDTQGQIQNAAGIPVQLNRAGTGAVSPLGFQLNLVSGADNVTALTSVQSVLAATYQDGAPLGVLSSFGVGADGVITGAFSNGLTRTLGQVALATFANQEGLVDRGNNLFSVGTNSGSPVITTPGSFGTGLIVGGALELSNVDLGQEFINMITTSTGYSASSRVIRTVDELMQQLLVIGR